MKNILETIGNTPLVRIGKLNPNPRVNILAKVEGFNPTGSVKDRIALAMIEKAEREGILKKGKIIVEPTSGNTGISLAMVGTIKGYRVKIVMPENMSPERRKMIRALGANLILFKGSEIQTIHFAKELTKKNKNFVLLNQFENEVNVQVHYEETAQEILAQVKEKIDIFVAGIGTGGTIMGIGKRLKEKYPKSKVVGIQTKKGSEIQGLISLKEKYIPPILDLNLIDEIVEVGEEKALKMMKKLAKEEGIFAGMSSGAAIYVAAKIARELKKGNILTIFPDRGEKYLSMLK